ncbi:MAG: hypothetical protein JWM34_4432 [Ilumatobacteraceae bacterium]|nr:hypothetical protein [Ilumatobacteraceae bacterium]
MFPRGVVTYFGFTSECSLNGMAITVEREAVNEYSVTSIVSFTDSTTVGQTEPSYPDDCS